MHGLKLVQQIWSGLLHVTIVCDFSRRSTISHLERRLTSTFWDVIDAKHIAQCATYLMISKSLNKLLCNRSWHGQEGSYNRSWHGPKLCFGPVPGRSKHVLSTAHGLEQSVFLYSVFDLKSGPNQLRAIWMVPCQFKYKFVPFKLVKWTKSDPHLLSNCLIHCRFADLPCFSCVWIHFPQQNLTNTKNLHTLHSCVANSVLLGVPLRTKAVTSVCFFLYFTSHNLKF